MLIKKILLNSIPYHSFICANKHISSFWMSWFVCVQISSQGQPPDLFISYAAGRRIKLVVLEFIIKSEDEAVNSAGAVALTGIWMISSPDHTDGFQKSFSSLFFILYVSKPGRTRLNHPSACARRTMTDGISGIQLILFVVIYFKNRTGLQDTELEPNSVLDEADHQNWNLGTLNDRSWIFTLFHHVPILDGIDCCVLKEQSVFLSGHLSWSGWSSSWG